MQLRADELGIDLVRQGVDDKLGAVTGIVADLGLAWEQVAFMGDDLPDLPVVLRCGVGIAVADACAELRTAAAVVTALPGGKGAVREVIERMLRARGGWEAIVDRYAAAQPAGPGAGRA